MASYHDEGEANPASPEILVSIDTLDASARKLYRRARNAGSSFETIATFVRDLHTVLKHLKVEAEDPESLLNTNDGFIYTRQLTPIIEDTEFTLKQLDSILEKYFDSGSGGSSISGDGEHHVVVNDGDKGWTMLDSLEVDKIDLIRDKLASQKLNIDMFLDTIQLHNPSKSHQLVDTTNADLDAIKDKVDAIASRLYQREDSGFGENEDRLWEQFRDALEEEGFSKDILQKHRDILRAYIRQIDEQITAFGGTAPSVRGLLENYAPLADPDNIPPYPAYPGPIDISEGNPYSPDINNEKFFPSMRIERLRYDDYSSQPTQLSSRNTGLSYDYDDKGKTPSSSMALISTRELMAMDRKNTGLALTTGKMHMSPSMNGNYVTSGSRPQRTRGSPSRGSTNQGYTRLGPDSKGRQIPPDAKWTRIRRSLVSPEVLALEGLRYEARPEFVAILGELKRDDIAELARKSAEVRNGRRGSVLNASGGPTQARVNEGRWRQEDAYHPDKCRNWDVIESRYDQNGPGYVIDPHRRPRANSTVSSVGELWDSSDDEAPTDAHSHAAFSRYSTSYPPPSQPHSSPRPRNGSNREMTSGDGDGKGTKAYPVIAPPLTEKGKTGEGREKTSPSATVKPKPILKNKNDDPHVRFDPEPQVFDDSRRDRGKEMSARDYRDRDRDKVRPRDRDREKRYRSDRYFDRERRPDRDADRDRERDHRHNGSSSNSKYYVSTSGGRRDDPYSRRAREDRDRDRNRDRDRDRDRGNRKKARNETLRAVGIGGAAASLLSVLTEAAAGL